MRERGQGDDETGNPSGDNSGGDGVCDCWPQGRREKARLIVKIDRLARQRLRSEGFDLLQVDRSVDRVTEILLRRLRAGNLPEKPKAWSRKVVDNLLKSSKRSGRNRPIGLGQIAEPCAGVAGGEASARRLLLKRRAWIEENLDRLGLTAKQRKFVEAAFANESLNGAAAALGMDASNLRRDLARVAEKISAKIRAESGIVPGLSDPLPPS